MCYYNGQKLSFTEFLRLKQIEKEIVALEGLDQALISGFDYGNSWVLKPVSGKEDFTLQQMEWGFIPTYIRNRKELEHFRKGGHNPKTNKYDTPVITLNAIGEEILEKVTYKKAALEKHCLIPSSGFFEWRHINPISKKTGQPLKTAVKYPYHIRMRSHRYFYMAGIWNEWTDSETGEYVESFSILTTKANSLMEKIHNSKMRMPLILDEEHAWDWLFNTPDTESINRITSYQFPAELMEAYSIQKDFQQSPDPLRPASYPDLDPPQTLLLL